MTEITHAFASVGKVHFATLEEFETAITASNSNDFLLLEDNERGGPEEDQLPNTYLDDSKLYFYIQEQDGTISAVATTLPDKHNDVLECRAIAVRPEYRNLGYEHALIDSVMKYAIQNGQILYADTLGYRDQSYITVGNSLHYSIFPALHATNPSLHIIYGQYDDKDPTGDQRYWVEYFTTPYQAIGNSINTGCLHILKKTPSDRVAQALLPGDHNPA